MENQIELTILLERVEEVNKALQKLVKKATSRNTEPMTITWGELVEKKRWVDTAYGTRVVVTTARKCVISGIMPKVGDYEFIARLDYLLIDGTRDVECVVNAVPGKTAPPEFREYPDTYCDHCKTNRFRRNCFVIKDADGVHLQVGRSCLQDFLCEDASKIFNRFEFINDAQDFSTNYFGRAGDGGQPLIIEILAVANTLIRMNGWMSASQASAINSKETGDNYVESTADQVRDFFFKKDKYGDEFRKKVREAAEAFDDWGMAETILGYIQGDEFNGSSDYVQNLKTITKNAVLPESKYMGIVVSAAAAYNRHVETLTRRELEKKEVITSEFIGAVKDRIETNVTILNGRLLETGSILYKMVDACGNRLCWFATSAPGFKTGDTIHIKGTVRAHNEYKGVKETLLTRVKEI